MPEVVEKQPEAVAVTTPPVKRFEIPEDKVETPAESPPAETQNKGVEAPPATPEAKPEEVTPEQAAKREGRRFERRLDKAYRARAEAEARAKVLEEEVARLKTPSTPQGEREPKLEDFEYDPEKYAAAKADFAKKQATKEFETKQKSEVETQRRQKLTATWTEKVEAAGEKYDDFEEKVGDLQPTNPLLEAIIEADNGADIAYHLATNLKDAQRIASLSLTAALREIGKLEVKLAEKAAKPEEPKAPSKAPAPITPLTGQAPMVTDQPTDQDDIRDWIRKRQKQVHGR